MDEKDLLEVMKKILFLVLDGLGDEPIPEFGGKTPLEKAETPYLDRLAEEGRVGLLELEFSGALPTSEEGHLQLFGYDPQKLGIRRGLFTARGAGLEPRAGDVALRGNLGTLEKGKVVDRRAGRIETGESKKLIKALRGIEVGGVEWRIKSATEHRLGIVMRGENLSPFVSDSDPFYTHLSTGFEKVRPLKDTEGAGRTARALNEFLERSREVLGGHSLNEKRKKKNLPPANCVLTRGASACRELEPFKEKWGLESVCIAGKPLYKQIAEALGMKVLKVEGATGEPDTDLEAKFEKAIDSSKKYQFLFVHVKATDSLAEDGSYLEKRDFIEKVDRRMKILGGLKETLIVVTCDHSTCSLKQRHCDLPCPLLVWGAGRGSTSSFGEKSCRRGALGSLPMAELMERLLSLRSQLARRKNSSYNKRNSLTN